MDTPASASQLAPSFGQPSQSSLKPANTVMGGNFQNNPNTPSSLGSSDGTTNGVAAGNVNTNIPFPGLAAAGAITEEEMERIVPQNYNAEQRKEFYTAYRMRSLNAAMATFFATLPVGSDPSNAIAYYGEKRLEIMSRIFLPKRKIGTVEEAENDSPTKLKRLETSVSTLSMPTQSHDAQSIGAFRNVVNQPLQNGTTTPSQQSPQSQPFLNGSTTPSINTSKPPTTNPPSPTPRGKRRAESQLTKGDYQAQETELKKSSSAATPNGSSNTSALFKSIVESPTTDNDDVSTNANPQKKFKPLSATTSEQIGEDAPRNNPFATLKMPASSAPTGNMFTPSKPTAPTGNIFSLKPAAQPSTSLTPQAVFPAANPFQAVSSRTGGPGAATATNLIKPPNFGTGPVNFIAQFSQQASKSKEESEKKLMQKAKDEDFDSEDDDLEEWEAKYKVKRAEELKKLEDLANSSKGRGFTPVSAPTSSNNSMFGSVNGSREPTPSVLDSFKPSKQRNTSDNIFGHLASQPTTNGSKDDADSNSDEEDADADSENKDPSYQPGGSSPIEDTGAGLASAKKPLSFGVVKSGLFDKSASSTSSGTSTPGRSLFDRINKDDNGNPIRVNFSEEKEKENKEPLTSNNVFANTTNPFQKSFNDEVPIDKTWNPESPIKFSNPEVNVTAATPPKANKPFSNLFGNTANPKPTTSSEGVGFTFGGLQSTSTPSSLFPSLAASSVTSRATTPGGTTDGESDTDPVAETHEQISLTSGGPGEEDEDVLHEVRVKAQIYEDGEWKIKGVGPLRILKHKETNATRILVRADPRGTIVLNKAILPQTYAATEKTVKLAVAADEGQTLETWILQVKTKEFAAELAQALEANKSS
jgi:hypothetical protein